jgi:hypothetical protein
MDTKKTLIAHRIQSMVNIREFSHAYPRLAIFKRHVQCKIHVIHSIISLPTRYPHTFISLLQFLCVYTYLQWSLRN